MAAHETVKEIAEREALEAEAETGDDEQADQASAEREQDAPAEQPAPPPPPTPQELETAQRQLDRESKRHAAAVAKIMGADFADLSDCPCCQIPGFVFPFQAGAGYDEERRAAVEAYFGASQPDYREAADRGTCEACAGLGEVLSGSRHPLHRVVPCSPCGGLGWVQRSAQVAPIASITGSNYPPSGGATTGAEQGAPDLWGRPPGHPHFGMAPAAVGA